MEWMPQAIRDGIIVVLIISGPLVLAAAFIGLIVGILQAATQVQEQTIGSALKIIGVFALIIFAGFWMFQYLNQYTSRTFSQAFSIVPHQSQKVIPRDIPDKAFKEEKTKIGGLQPLKVNPPEEIKIKEPIQGSAPGVPSLGAPEAARPPKITEIVPPKIPQAPTQIIKPQIPNIQELKPILPPPPPPPSLPASPANKNETQNTETPLINLLPISPEEIKKELEAELWQRDEMFKENLLENKTANEETNDEELLN